MLLLAATPDGLYRVDLDNETQVLDADVRAVRVAEGTAYAVTSDGLLESTDAGKTWRHCALPMSDVHSVEPGENLLAGVRPLTVYRRTDGWTTLEGLCDLASREGWPTPSFRDDAWARTLATDGDRVLVGVEVGGLAVRDEDGTWRSAGPAEENPQAAQRRDDVHHVAVRSRGEWVLGTGDGAFYTTDAGETWTRLDTGTRRYCRETCSVGERLYVGVNASPPRWNPPDAAVYAGPPGDLRRVRYPGGRERFVVSWASDGDIVYAGANDGTILRFDGRNSETVASVPVSEVARTAYGVRSLAVV
ncbi:hypothetical protein [Halobacterium zhouii]|uniref:hypothetical protein n=1 Tax=Halobacterium zhouii TaxID=2902624 RepID=UPI001E32C253|nr:hypothetical protein [Halobacterium zhouii]